MMCYLRQQCRKRPPDVLLQQEYDSDSCNNSDENHAEIDYPDEEDDVDYTDDNNSPGSPISASEVTGRIEGGEQMEEYHQELFISDSDSESDFHQTYSFLVRRHVVTDLKSENQKSAVVSCCVCNNSVRQQQIRLDELDHHPSFQFQEDMGFFNPCKKHVTCVSCIRQSLLVVNIVANCRL